MKAIAKKLSIFKKKKKKKKKKTAVKQKNASAKYMCNYAANLNKNRSFQNVNHEKCVNFADFQQNKCIFAQPIGEKDVSFADFW